MRGFVMVLMAIDHASVVLNGDRIAHDGIWDLTGLGVLPNPTPLDPAQFWTRWITHLCAPTFLFLSGTALALSVARREQGGATPRSIDRHLAARGLVLLVLELAWMSPVMSLGVGHYAVVLGVLWAIGCSLLLMVPLRRLSNPVLVAVAFCWFVGSEWIVLAAAPPDRALGVEALLLAPEFWGQAAVLYPVASWLAMTMLGWAFGRMLLEGGALARAPARWSALCGLASLGVFAVVRGVNGYGNLGLLRRDGSLVEWLHVSKYPPSLSFASLELGLMALALSAFFLLERRLAAPSRRDPLRVLGQTALFFYLLHIHLIGLAAGVSGLVAEGGLVGSYAFGLGAAILLLPACVWYRGYKNRNPNGFARYV